MRKRVGKVMQNRKRYTDLNQSSSNVQRDLVYLPLKIDRGFYPTARHIEAQGKRIVGHARDQRVLVHDGRDRGESPNFDILRLSLFQIQLIRLDKKHIFDFLLHTKISFVKYVQIRTVC